MVKRIASLLVAATLIFALCACSGGEAQPTPTPSGTPKTTATPKPTPIMEATPDMTKTKIVIEMANGDKIKAELYPETAPITVANFQNLVDQHFYDGLTFHRIINGFMIQGGDPLGTGMGGSGVNIKGEFSENGVENDLKHTRGVLSMARSQSADSASSQFFIMHQDAPHLDGLYAAFGKVTEGMEVVDKLATETPVTDSQSGTVTKENQPKIKSITFE